ncbi:MAG TPA: nitrate reductase molybdenum cofactor assembly chaperone [Actinomycetes bacterium]|nr:nitrate reductase molybdenum cofactor assembly chaperone [Actinomycetes bacterium]
MTAAADRITYHVASWCLDYPTPELVERTSALRGLMATVAGEIPAAVEQAVDHMAWTPLESLQERYVELFDFNRRHSLHLSYWTDGDTRRRGEVLLRFKQRYRASGFLVNTHGELPDYLPIVLDYAASANLDDGRALLQEYRPSLELLRFALLETDPLYGGLVTAVCATLPGASPSDRRAAQRMAAAGPPREDVGLEPFDPRLLPLAQTVAGGDGVESGGVT